MNYYKSKRIVLNKLNKIFKQAKKEKQEIDLNELRLQIMLNNDIGENSINQSIDLLSKHYGFNVIDDEITWD